MVTTGTPALTVDEWEQEIGRQVRQLRLRADRTQHEVAREANVSLSTLQSLERGEGSSLKTLIQVARALGRADWLGSLAPPEPAASPMARLREQQQATRDLRQRASGATRQRASGATRQRASGATRTSAP